MFYRKNVGVGERFIRGLAGCGMIFCGVFAFPKTSLGMILIASGVVTIATGLFGFCPACAMVGKKPVE